MNGDLTLKDIEDRIRDIMLGSVDPSKPTKPEENAYISVVHRPDGYFSVRFPYPGTVFFTGLGGFIRQCELGCFYPIVYNGQLMDLEDQPRFLAWCKELLADRINAKNEEE